MSLSEAHDVASHLEAAIASELGDGHRGRDPYRADGDARACRARSRSRADAEIRRGSASATRRARGFYAKFTTSGFARPRADISASSTAASIPRRRWNRRTGRSTRWSGRCGASFPRFCMSSAMRSPPAEAGLAFTGCFSETGGTSKLFPSFFQIYPNISLGISKLFQTFFLAF